MRIERIRIRGYRSLYNVDFDPAKFSVLVGPNNSGKSNLVEALDFLADVHRHGVEVAISRKGGFENIAHRRMRRTKWPLTFTVDAAFTQEEVEYRGYHRRVAAGQMLFASESAPAVRMRHTFQIGAAAERLGADFSVKAEELRIWDLRLRSSDPVATVTRAGDEVQFTAESREGRKQRPADRPVHYPLDDPEFHDFVRRTVTPNELALKALDFNETIQLYERALGSARLYQLAPIECRRAGVSTPNADVDLHGGNLPALVAYMRRNHKDAWRLILNAMRRVIPALTDIREDFTHDRRLTLRFEEAGVGRPWTSEDVSDGTVQSLALFAALFDPRSPLVMIEEPENSVHPWIIRSFVDACREVVSKQIILTTHSPALIDYLSPAEVWVVWRREGRTNVAQLSKQHPDAELLWERGDTSVFELLDSGLLEVAVPGGYQ